MFEPASKEAGSFLGRSDWLFNWLKGELDDEQIAPAVAESPHGQSGCGSGSEGTRDGPSGLPRKTGREKKKERMLGFEFFYWVAKGIA